jgi:OmpA-OmpF porin, OOP family
MKKLLLSVTLLVFTASFAQENEKSNEFNRWSIDINGGLSKPTNPFNTGYYVDNLSLFHVDLGARYMFNPIFGAKVDFGYDDFKNGDKSIKFNTTYNRVNLQGVLNLGRALKFESFTKRFNIQLHSGIGYSFMTSENFQGNDEMTNFLVGLTGQVKISDKIAFNTDFTIVNNIRQAFSFDGTLNQSTATRGFDGTLYNATLGFSFYLGKNTNHADWTYDIEKDVVEELKERLAQLETMLNDTDRDGVPDYLDAENNTTTGVAVDLKGRAIDTNNNGVPDEMERYLDKKIKEVNTSTVETESKKSAEELINERYINIYFDTNSHYPKSSSTDDIYFIVNYMKMNPNSTAEIIGYADVRGANQSNLDLSKRRAERVKFIMEKAGIDSSRMTVVPQGEDNSVNKDSKDALSLVRKVTFRVK